jgi:hypothetical protein
VLPGVLGQTTVFLPQHSFARWEPISAIGTGTNTAGQTVTTYLMYDLNIETPLTSDFNIKTVQVGDGIVIEDFGVASEICSFEQKGAKIGEKVPCQEAGFQNPTPTRTLTGVVFGAAATTTTSTTSVTRVSSAVA